LVSFNFYEAQRHQNYQDWLCISGEILNNIKSFEMSNFETSNDHFLDPLEVHEWITKK
jgi:hypothetical protein